MTTTEPFERQERYIVVKRSKMNALQEGALRAHLARLDISLTSAVVVEEDWPEYEPVWRMLEERFTNPCPHCRGHGHVHMLPREGGATIKVVCGNCRSTGVRAVIGDKPPTLDTAPHDLAHGPEVPHHRFSVFCEAGHYAYARGLEINPGHLPIALDAMRKSGWHLVSIFGATDSKHVGFVFKRDRPSARELELADRVDELLRANNELVEQNRALKRGPARQSYSELEPGNP